MFKYSSRPGTKAAEYDNQIDEDSKQDRLERLIKTQSKITLLQNKKKIGSIEYVLIEKESKKSKDFWSGSTDGNTWTIINEPIFHTCSDEFGFTNLIDEKFSQHTIPCGSPAEQLFFGALFLWI